MRNWLREARKEKKMTMKVLAKEIGISECYYSQIENGSRNASVSVAKKIGRFLEIPWEKFFE